MGCSKKKLHQTLSINEMTQKQCICLESSHQTTLGKYSTCRPYIQVSQLSESVARDKVNKCINCQVEFGNWGLITEWQSGLQVRTTLCGSERSPLIAGVSLGNVGTPSPSNTASRKILRWSTLARQEHWSVLRGGRNCTSGTCTSPVVLYIFYTPHQSAVQSLLGCAA